jgi:hypothetical protein
VYSTLSLRSGDINTTKAPRFIWNIIVGRLPASDQRSPCCGKKPRAVTKETPALLSQCTLGMYLPGVVAVNIYVGSLIVKAGIRLTKQLFEERQRLFTLLLFVEGMWKNSSFFKLGTKLERFALIDNFHSSGNINDSRIFQ